MTTERGGKDVDGQIDDRGREFIAVHHAFPANIQGFLVAPVLWFGYFIAIYALQGAGCALGLDDQRFLGVTTLRLVLVSVTAIVVLAMGLFGMWSFRSWSRLLHRLDDEQQQRQGHSVFLAYGAVLHAGLFLLATLWIGLPVLLIDSCDRLGSS